MKLEAQILRHGYEAAALGAVAIEVLIGKAVIRRTVHVHGRAPGSAPRHLDRGRLARPLPGQRRRAGGGLRHARGDASDCERCFSEPTGGRVTRGGASLCCPFYGDCGWRLRKI